MAAIGCDTCVARCNGFFADYCSHIDFIETFPGEGRPIPRYPKIPSWCPGYVAEDDPEGEVA